MRIFKKPYLDNLFKENILYIVLDVILIFLILFSLSIGVNRIIENESKLSQLEKEVQELQRRVNILNQITADKSIFDTNIKLLNRLIPNIEDYFSVIYALEKLSQSTNFLITSYDIYISQSKFDKLRVTISGSGDSTSFINFLKEYNFAGGRLITSDNIEISPQQQGVFKIDLTFYNKKVETDSSLSLPISFNQELFEELKKIREKMAFVLKEETDEIQINTSYPRKSNPF